MRTQTQEPPAPVKPTARVDESANVKAGLLAFAERAAQSLDLSPEAARAQMRSGDPGSDLAQAVAKLAGVDAAEAAKTLSDEAKQIEQKAKAKTTGFICMYCGNSNPSCPYRERPDKDRFNAARSLD